MVVGWVGSNVNALLPRVSHVCDNHMCRRSQQTTAVVLFDLLATLENQPHLQTVR
jgi:hypothetical protein